MRLIVISLFTVIFYTTAQAQQQDLAYSASSVETYKQIGDIELKSWIYNPPGHTVEEPKPAVVFFFGGGWRNGSPKQFIQHCQYLANRGMIAMTADYRVFNRHGNKANVCVGDAKSVIRWMRIHADRLGIDPHRIMASGGSAGGHLAAATALLPAHDDQNDALDVNCRPNALALFNPALVLDDVPGVIALDAARKEQLVKRMGAELESMSPYHHIHEEVGPTIIFHGTGDSLVDIKTVVIFNERMNQLGNTSSLIAYQGEPHGFFNHGKKSNGPYVDTMQRLDAFLVKIGYLSAPPNVIIH